MTEEAVVMSGPLECQEDPVKLSSVIENLA